MWDVGPTTRPQKSDASLQHLNLEKLTIRVKKRPVQADSDTQTSIEANPLAFNLKQENQNRIQENYERKESSIKFDSNRKTVQRGVGPSHETPAAASAGLQPARLARNGNRAFTRRVETTSIGLKPMRLVLITTRQIRLEKPWGRE